MAEPVGATVTQARVLEAITEGDFQEQVVALAQVLGWRAHWVHDSRRSPEGWPDVTLCRPPRLIIAELKTMRGRATPGQLAWLADLERVPGVEAYLWRPSDWEEIKWALRLEGQAPP